MQNLNKLEAYRELGKSFFEKCKIVDDETLNKILAHFYDFARLHGVCKCDDGIADDFAWTVVNTLFCEELKNQIKYELIFGNDIPEDLYDYVKK